MGGAESKSNPAESNVYKIACAALGTDLGETMKVFQMVCSNTKGSVTADALEAQTTSLQASLFSSVSPQTIANLVFTAHKKLNENAPPPPADAPPPARPTAITSYGYAVLAAAVAKLGPLDKFRFYFGMIAGGDEATPELLEALLVETAAYAFDQPGVAMPPNPKAHDGGGDGGDDDDEDGEDDDDVGDGAGAGGGGAGGAARAARKQLEAAARAEAAAAKAAEAAAALAAIEIPKATAAEQLRLVKSLVKMAFRVPGRKGFLGETKQVLDKEGFVTFLEHYSVTEAVFDKVFVEGMRFPNPRTGNHLGPFLIPAVSRLLSPCDVAMLYYAVPDEIRDDWSLCFSSDRDGGSFASLRRQILDTGSTLIVVKDKEGHVFGGFALEHWKQKPEFYGSEGCFLFSLQPEMAVHRPSNLNQNFMYFNYGMETLPNGLGMGGQFNYFGLYIDASFDKGHCNAQPLSTTYNSPMLSKTTEFLVDTIEVWRIGPKPVSKQVKKKGILDGTAEDQALLEMAGKKMHSKELREPFDSDEGVIDPKTGKIKRPVY